LIALTIDFVVLASSKTHRKAGFSNNH
jgi:hypothetical protein